MIAATIVKVEFQAETPGLPVEWMWVRVDHCDEARQLLFGTLDNAPVVNLEDLQLGQELGISYGQIREHRKPSEFRKNLRLKTGRTQLGQS
jgi:hypothetical protein